MRAPETTVYRLENRKEVVKRGKETTQADGLRAEERGKS